MNTEIGYISSLIDIALGFSKDRAFSQALIQVRQAQREYLTAEADLNRKKARSIIEAILQIDISTEKLKRDYARIEQTLNDDAKDHFDKLFASLQAQRNHLIKEKNSLSVGAGK